MFCVRMVNTIRSNSVTFIWSNPIHITPIPGPDYRLLCHIVQDKRPICKRETMVCSIGIQLDELWSYAKIEMKNEALCRQTVSPLYVLTEIVVNRIGRLQTAIFVCAK